MGLGLERGQAPSPREAHREPHLGHQVNLIPFAGQKCLQKSCSKARRPMVELGFTYFCVQLGGCLWEAPFGPFLPPPSHGQELFLVKKLWERKNSTSWCGTSSYITGRFSPWLSSPPIPAFSLVDGECCCIPVHSTPFQPSNVEIHSI